MSFKTDDIITFDDGSQQVVLTSLIHEGSEYLYVCGLTKDESDVDGNFEVLCANYQTGLLDRVADLELLNVLLPMFLKNLEEIEKE